MLDHTVRHTATVLTSEAKNFFAEAVARGIMASDDHSFLASVGNSSASAFYAVTGKGEVVGILAYTVLELVSAVRIDLLFVEESSRKLGISSSLFSELKSFTERMGAAEIFIDVPGNDDVFIDVIEKAGGVVSTYRYVFELGNGDSNGKLLGPTG